jgi:UDP-N-acetylglucosamine transferase subunit ALG13
VIVNEDDYADRMLDFWLRVQSKGGGRGWSMQPCPSWDQNEHFDITCLRVDFDTGGVRMFMFYLIPLIDEIVPKVDKKEKIVFTGNPVRQDLLDSGSKRTEGVNYFKLDPNKKTLLVLGGSLGARRINQLIAKELDFLLQHDIQVFWQCGKLYYEAYKHLEARSNVHVVAFIDRMDLIYAAADFVISRAGASSVSELCLVGKPTLFIPSPNVAEDHQTKNAKAMVEKVNPIKILACPFCRKSVGGFEV